VAAGNGFQIGQNQVAVGAVGAVGDVLRGGQGLVGVVPGLAGIPLRDRPAATGR